MNKLHLKLKEFTVISITICLLASLVITPFNKAYAQEATAPSTGTEVAEPTGKTVDLSTPATDPSTDNPEITPPETDPTIPTEPVDKDPKDDTAKDPVPTEKPKEDPQAPVQNSLIGGGAQDSAKFNIPTQPKASVDQATGSLQYAYPISLPSGRNGMTPELSLKYDSRNSSKPDSLIALGWETSIPSIVREPVMGVNNLYTKAYFSSSESGNLIATTDTSSSQFTTYRPESDDGDYLKYTYNSNNSWTVTGKDGRTYTFGAAASSRQDNPADTTKVYKWMLSKIADTHGNEIQYTYTKANGQIYPNQILYTYNPTSPAVNTVTFNYTSPANYGATTYNAGFAVTTYKVMSSIVISSTVGDNPTVSSTYTLVTTASQFLKQLNLMYIQKTADIPSYIYNDNFSDLTYFNYSTKATGWEQGGYSLNGLGLPTDLNAGWMPGTYTEDFDKNGYSDLLISASAQDQKFLLNNGTNFVESSTAWSLPSHLIGYHDAILDLNGDQLPDFQPRNYDVGETPTPVYLNSGSGFVAQSNNTWDISHYVSESAFCGPNVGDSISYESNLFLEDINNDGKNDILYFGGTSDFRVFLNNGNGWTQSSAYTFTPAAGQSFTITPHCGNPPTNSYQTMLDLNGDGNLDYFNQSKGAYLNTGSGFTYNSTYSVVMGQPSRSGFADINGDNLIDLITYSNTGGNPSLKTYLNNGNGLTLITSTIVWDPGDLHYTMSNSSYWGALIDITADGYPDIVARTQAGGDQTTLHSINDATSAWVSVPSSQQANNWQPIAKLRESMYLDINNDGVLDFVTSKTNFGGTIYNSMVHMGKAAVPNRLTKITTPFGGQTVIDYSTSPTNLSDTQISPMPVVKKITEQNIGYNQPDMVTQYAYSGGEYITDSITKQKRFTGFHKVTATESGSNLTPIRVTDSYFLQANGSDSSTNEPTDNDISLIGRNYYTVTKNPAGTLKKETWNKYGMYTLATEPNTGRVSKFVYPTETVSKTTEPGATTGTAETYTFDTSIGEQTQLQNLGFVNASSDGTYTDISGDTRYQVNEYASNGSGTIIKSKREDIRTSPSSSDTISRTDHYYDSQAFGSIGSYGDTTKDSSWISGNGSVVADTTYTYDAYGNVLTVTNPRSAITTYTYDSSKSLIATETNHLNQTTTYTYLAWLPKTVVDPNGRTTTYDYTKLGYLYITTTQNTLGNQVDRQYIANFGDSGFAIEHFKYIDTGNIDNHTELQDNDGRTVRTLNPRLTDGKYYLTQANTYDALGRMVTQSAPYGTGSADETSFFTTNVPANLITTTNYDVFDRPASVVNSVGTTSMAYSGAETTTTDANSHQKKTSTDAYGNLIQVKEYNNSSTYTTNYTYDSRNLLTNITDALGNIRNFSYNNAGWLTNSEDLHAVGDGSFGSISYTYDLDGNKLVETQPNGVTVTRVYDMLDRPTSIDGSSTGATDYTLTYDACTNGKGRICSVSGTLPNSVTLSKSYVYSISGAPTSVSVTTLGNTYTTNYLYDYTDRVKKITYPNGTIVRYTFGDWGQPNAVYLTLPGQTETVYAIATYTVTEQPDTIVMTNGPTTTYTYDSAKLYRKTNQTSVQGGNTLQSYAYTYDPVGNITSIAEPSLTKTYTYDDLNRLTQAVHTPSTGGATTYSYAYDAIGNITSANGNSYTYSGTGKTNPQAVTSIGSSNYTYDDSGNIATAPNQTFTYNWQNQPVSTVVGGSINITSAYDESGNRFLYQTPTNTEIQAEGNYLIRNGSPEISISLGDSPIGTISNNIAYSAIDDHLGTPVKQVDSTGAVVENVSYDPFGGIISQTGSLNTKKGYTGHEEDVDTGLVYAQARYYNPGIGRFYSQDLVFKLVAYNLSDPQSSNGYSYVRNNPIILIDPNGQFFREAWNAFSGFSNAWVTNNFTLGAGRQQRNDYYYQQGQRAGDIVSFIQGGVETGIGMATAVTGTAGGIVTAPTGVGAFAGAGITAGGLVVAGHGTSVSAIATSHLGPGGQRTIVDISRDSNWRDPSKLQKHFGDHGKDFGAIDEEDYARKAQGFRGDAESRGYMEKVDANGDSLIYDEKTNSFGVYDSSGKTRTYFKPERGRAYFDEQRGKLINRKK